MRFDQIQSEEDFLEWREANKWRLKYTPSRRGANVAHAVVQRWLSGWCGGDNVFPLETLPNFHGAHDAASTGCWDVFDHYIEKMNRDLEEANREL